MEAYDKERLENAIGYFASEYKKRTHKPITQTTLYKLLAIIDFKSVKETGKPVFNLKYLAREKGPVPIEIYEKRYNYNTPLFEFIEKEGTFGKSIYILSKAKPNMDYFSEYEIKIMEESIFIFADSSVKTKHLIESSHKEIKALVKAYKRRKNPIIDYADEFDGDLSAKSEKELTLEEERYLIWEALNDTKEKSHRSRHSA